MKIDFCVESKKCQAKKGERDQTPSTKHTIERHSNSFFFRLIIIILTEFRMLVRCWPYTSTLNENNNFSYFHFFVSHFIGMLTVDSITPKTF